MDAWRPNVKICRHLLVAVALLYATPLLAGIRYEFTETSRTEETAKSSTLTARAFIEGGMSRLEILAGTQYTPGNYIISHGDNRFYIVDPPSKTYVEYTVPEQKNDTSRIKITNLKTSFSEVSEPGSNLVAGYPTKHYRLQLSYDIEVMMGTMPIRQHIETQIDKWMTTAFDHLIAQYRENVNDLKTGNPEIDAIIETESTKFKGLALRERTQIVATSEKSSNKNNPLPSTRKRITEMVVSKIEEAPASPNLFVVPVEFVAGKPSKAPTTTTQYLTMQPATP